MKRSAAALLCGFLMTQSAHAERPQGEASGLRPLSVEDLLSMESIGRVVVTPDARWLLFERIGALRSAPNLGLLHDTLDRSVQAHVYVLDLSAPGDAVPLVSDDPEQGQWIGSLSPDGSHAALFVAARDRISMISVRLSDRKVTAFPDAPNYGWKATAPVWISNSEIIYSAAPRGVDSSLVAESRAGFAHRLQSLWSAAFAGDEPTATVLTSTPDGLSEAADYRPGVLVRADSRSGAAQALSAGYFYNLTLSPDRKHLAGLKQGGRIQIRADESFADEAPLQSELMVFDLQNGHAGAKSPCPGCNALPNTIAWSADGRTLSYVAGRTGQTLVSAELHQYDTVSDTSQTKDTGRFQFACPTYIRPSALPVTAFGSDVVAFGHLKKATDDALLDPVQSCDLFRSKARDDWYLIREGSAPKNLTSTFGAVTGNLVGVDTKAIYLMADSAIWKLSRRGSKRTRVAALPSGTKNRGTSGEGAAIPAYPPDLRVLLDSDGRVQRLDLRRGQVTAVANVPPDATLLDGAVSSGTLAFRTLSGNAIRLSVVRPATAPRMVLELNQHMNQVEEAEKVQITYHSPQGTALSSCMLLPKTTSARQPLPTVVYVYPNLSEPQCWNSNLTELDPYNFQLLTARGYAVLFPVTPRELISTAEGPTRGITDVVLAAVDAAVAQGFTDPSRMALYGISQGNHVALQMLTETQRFKAAVAAYGLSDFASAYGSAALSRRLADIYVVPYASRFELPSANWLGVKPWEDPDRYVENSPAFFAQRIQTPVLLIHSDFDTFPLSQSDEMFSALYRLRKPAVYVTYWGEGHGNLSPANIRDMWSRIFEWYDVHLRAK
jgi:dipeptidyl aminopeptidase/acylaminoacyl peptidase